MGSLTELFDNILGAMGHYDVSNRDPLIFLALFFAITALGLGLSKIFVKRNVPHSGKISKLTERVDELSLRVDDFAGRLNTAGTNFERIINDVRQRMRAIEERLERVEEGPISSPDFELYGGENIEDRLNFLQEAVEKMLGSFTHEDNLQLSLEGEEPDDLDFDAQEEEAVEDVPPLSYAAGLTKSRDFLSGKLRATLKAKDPDDAESLVEPLKEALLQSEFGASSAEALLEHARKASVQLNDMTVDDLRACLAACTAKLIEPKNGAVEIAPTKVKDLPKVVLIVGVNPDDKIAAVKRLATHFAEQGARVMVGACDSYSSSSRSELSAWGKESGIPVLSGPDKVKSTTIAYKALHRAQDDQADVLIVDTPSGHEKKTSVADEITKVITMISREQPEAPHEMIAVFRAAGYAEAIGAVRDLDASLNLTGLCAMGVEGCETAAQLVNISRELDLDIRYVSIADEQRGFKVFEPCEFAQALFTARNPESAQAAAA